MSLTTIPHAGLVHMPLALAVLIPLLYGLSWLSVKKGWLGANIWYGMVLLGFIQLISIVVGLHSGESAEFTSAAAKDAVEKHEHAAETFFYVWILLGILFIGSLWLRNKKYFWLMELSLIILFGVQAYLAFSTGHLGGDLIPR